MKKLVTNTAAFKVPFIERMNSWKLTKARSISPALCVEFENPGCDDHRSIAFTIGMGEIGELIREKKDRIVLSSAGL